MSYVAIDEYALKARYAPALLTVIIPIMLFNHFFVSAEFSKFVGELMGAKLASNLTISAICLYYFSEFGRAIGKNVFEKRYFRDESEMPTTTFLMNSDKTYSSEYKQKFRDRVQSEFGLTLPNADDEVEDESTARARVVEAMALVRRKLRGNEFLHQHNIEYGAMRNAIGGSVLGVFLSLLNIWFFSKVVPQELAVTLSGVTFALYLLLIVLSNVIMIFYGKNYAKVLFREYMGAS